MVLNSDSFGLVCECVWQWWVAIVVAAVVEAVALHSTVRTWRFRRRVCSNFYVCRKYQQTCSEYQQFGEHWTPHSTTSETESLTKQAPNRVAPIGKARTKRKPIICSILFQYNLMCLCCCHDIVSMLKFSITYFFGVVVVPVVILLLSLPLLLSAPHNILFFCYSDGWMECV